MKIKVRDGLFLINLLAILLIIAIFLSLPGFLRIILGLPFLLFFPGYALLIVLFPRRESIGGIERVALSFGMSIAVVPLIGLILNYTPWGIRLEPVLFSVAFFTLAMSIVGWLRLRRLVVSERFHISFDFKVPGWGGNILDKVLSIILIVAITGALGTLGYVVATPKVGERFTEFYILGIEGKAADYPKELSVGEEARVIVGIINREHETKSYLVEVRIDGMKSSEVGPITLEHDGKWEQEVSFTPNVLGINQKVEFILYKNGSAEPSEESLHLWINVTD